MKIKVQNLIQFYYSLSELEMLIAVELRSLIWWALDEITEAVNPEEPEKAKKFKEYDPGYIHLDVTYLPKIDGVKYYLFCSNR